MKVRIPDSMAEQRAPGIRIDGGKRIDLNKERVAARMSGVLSGAPTPHEIDVARFARRKADEKSRQRTLKFKRDDGGKDGTRLTKVKVKISADRHERHVVRSRPGTFEWRYGRNKQDALFHAGSHLAILWERAGMTVASSADFLRGTRSGYAQGIAEGRVAALDKLQGFRDELGAVPSAQLIDYCVEGRTAGEIAHTNGMKERDMATVLHHHLKVCALHFDFM
nr:hypothetical protein RAR13_04255 [Aminobacter aminovorans]